MANHDEGGRLTEAVDNKPYQVILFDEIEKADPAVFNLLLQILDDGRLTDGNGKTVDFRNTLILMTTNLGAREAAAEAKGASMHFGHSPAAPDDPGVLDAAIGRAVKEFFAPEFLNRLDGVLPFSHLTPADVAEVADQLIAQTRAHWAAGKNRLNVRFSGAARALLVAQGYNRAYGARPLERKFKTLGAVGHAKTGQPLSRALLAGELAVGSRVDLDARGADLVWRSIAPRTPRRAGLARK